MIQTAMGQAPQKQTITASQFASKAKSKREVYTLLVTECKCYLPPYTNVTIYHLKDLVSGRKKSKYRSSPFPNHSRPYLYFWRT